LTLLTWTARRRCASRRCSRHRRFGLLNSEFLNQQAEVFAARLRMEAGDDLRKQVRLGLYLVTSREPTGAEIKRGVRLVESLKAEEHATPEVALKYFCLMALNLNEMVYLD
jgi:hypothetical protein